MNWSKLPTDLIRKIIEMSEPSIDVRLAFGIKPKRLDEAKCWRLWWLLKSHDGVVYNLESKTLHVFLRDAHLIRRPISLDFHTAGLWVFNDAEEDHTYEIAWHNGSCLVSSSNSAWVTERRVLLKGAKPSRALTVEDSMLFSKSH